MASTYAPARRRTRWPIVLLVILVVLVGGFVVADRVTLGLAEDKAASALQQSEGLPHRPDVTVDGFPFLTQLLSGTFGQIDVTASDIPVGSRRALTLQKVDVHLHDVTVSNNYSTFHARTATADASVGYDELSKVLGAPVHAGAGGRLIAEPTVHLLGQAFHGRVSAIVHASSARGITFGDPHVTVDGVNIPQVVAGAVARVFSGAISLAGLPFSVRVTGIVVTGSALVVKLAGSDLTYRR